MKILIVGGGAAGLSCAITAKKTYPSHTVTVIEGNDRVGKKILTTGNGQCNLTHEHLSEDAYRGDVAYGAPILENYNDEKIIEFFESLGAVIKLEEDGRAYPYSLQAGSIVDLLRFEATKLGVEFLLDFKVKKIERNKPGFRLYTDIDFVDGDRVVIACGGQAAPHTGSDGSGYALLERFGHKRTNLYPVLVPLKCESPYLPSMKGMKTDAVATLYDGDRAVREEFGEVLFTEYGLSGPPIFQLSGEVHECHAPVISLKLVPEFSREEVTSFLKERIEAHPDFTLEQFFTGFLNKRIGMAVLKAADVTPLSRMTWSLRDQDIEELSRIICDWRFPVTGTLDWSRAQATHGGIRMEDFSMYTLESHLQRGLYAAGEILNMDGDCGGYNLHWAWASGMAVGEAIGKEN